MSHAVTRQFRASADQVSEARRFATEVVTSWRLDSFVVETVVGELAANAYLHAGTPFTLSLIRRRHAIEVAITDEGSEVPDLSRNRSCLPGDTSGRGLVIVHRLAKSCGVRRSKRGGKTVWAEIRPGAAPVVASAAMRRGVRRPALSGSSTTG